MNFTLFLNSRGRPKQLLHLIETYDYNAKYPELIEMFIRCDEDDLPTIEALKDLDKRGTFQFKVIVGPRPYNLATTMNEMALMGKGQYLFILNDDSEMVTKDWDELVLIRIAEYKKLNNIKDDILYVSIPDNSVDKIRGLHYASFPIISRAAVQVMGFFLYECFVGLGGDSAIHRVFDKIDRVVMMDDVYIDHIYHNNFFSVMSPDLIAHEMRTNSNNNPVDPFAININQEVDKLQQAITEQL